MEEVDWGLSHHKKLSKAGSIVREQSCQETNWTAVSVKQFPVFGQSQYLMSHKLDIVDIRTSNLTPMIWPPVIWFSCLSSNRWNGGLCRKIQQYWFSSSPVCEEQRWAGLILQSFFRLSFLIFSNECPYTARKMVTAKPVIFLTCN